ncbi:hypothetical protein GCM10023093_11760 [Nemorincola caseinilytica]|uniref:Lipoprotein n=1 Tax=Nemorincola caseinilytica TaxID=2054315 RepID=A0ABP8N9C6_9BACT
MCILSLLLSCTALTSCAGTRKKKNTGKKPVEYTLTVAAIRPAQPADQYVEISFLESARFYRLPRNADPSYIDLLQRSQQEHTPVLVKRANEYSDVILRVRKK